MPGGNNTITQWRTQNSSTQNSAEMALEVWRPTDSPTRFTLVGRSPTVTVPTGSSAWFSLSPPIGPVRTGDVIGLRLVSGFDCEHYTGNADDVVRTSTDVPSVGGTISTNNSTASQLLNLEAVAAYDLAYNEPPVAVDDSYSTPAGNRLTVDAPGLLANDTDYEGDFVEFTADSLSTTVTAHGSVDLYSDGSFDYYPESGYVGADSFTYTATDGLGTSNIATVTIAVPGPIDLGGLDGSQAELTSTDGRWASGWAYTADGAEHATATDLAAVTPQLIDLGTLGGTYSQAYAVDDGWVVGESSSTGDTETHAFAYNLTARSPSMRDLGTFGGDYSHANAVDAGRAVGEARDASGNNHAFVADLTAKRLRLVDLGTLPDGQKSAAYDLNGHWVVGEADVAGQDHGVAWDLSASSVTAVDLPPLPGDDSALAREVSGDWAIGLSYGPSSVFHGVAWDLTAATPTGLSLGESDTFAYGVDGTWAVGEAYVGSTYLPAFWDLSSGSPATTTVGTDDGFLSDVRNGWAVGQSNYQAFAVDLNDASHPMILLGRLGGDSMAHAVAGGWAVGRAGIPNGDSHAAAFRISDMLPASADLGVTVYGSGAAHSGKDYSVTVEVANHGPSPATHVALVIEGTAYPTFDLAPGAGHNEVFTTTAGAGGKGATLTITATVSSGLTDPNMSNNTDRLSVPIRGRG